MKKRTIEQKHRDEIGFVIIFTFLAALLCFIFALVVVNYVVLKGMFC